MKKTGLITIILVIFVAALVLSLQGCGENLVATAEVTQIQVKDTTVYLAPEGDAREFQLEPIVYPFDAKNKGVYYKHVNTEDRDYLNISMDGLLFARALKVDEYGNNIPIPIRLISADNPTVSVQVQVIIESVPVENLFFKDSNMEIQLHEGPVQLDPIFKPSHALKGRTLTYRTGNSDIATVSRTGVVTPRSIGVVDIWAVSRPEGSKVEITAHVIISITYAPLNYRLDMITTTSALNQIVGSPDVLSFVLNRLDNVCDPAPRITWYVNNTPINTVGVKDNPVLNYVPGNLPSGKYRIVAKLENSSQIQVLESSEINVYYPLENFNIDVWNSDTTFATGDILLIGATYADSVFPPESYKWEITTPSGREILFRRSTGAMSPIADLEYIFKESGTYTMKAMAVVKGISSGVYSNTLSLSVSTASYGTDIFGLSLEGRKVGTSYYPYISWDPLPYNTSYRVEIKKGNPGSETYFSYDSTNPDHEDNFEKNGMYIDIERANFNESFSYRVKGGRYNWSEWKAYQGGTISTLVYPYFDEILPGFNSYISSIEDFGKLLNYFAIFRPEETLKTGTNTYTFDLMIPIIADNLPEGVYTKGAATEPSSSDAGIINLYDLIAYTMATYVESTSYGVYWGTIQVRGGRNQFSLLLNTSDSPTSFEEDIPYTELDYITHYAAIPRGELETLPIDSMTEECEVSTSNELFWAAINGYKPVPVEGSSAEEIYRIARKVLYTIISSGMSDEQKVHAIYDWLSENVGYNHSLLDATQGGGTYDSTSDSFFMEGVFRGVIDEQGNVTEILRGTAVCDGISKAMSLLLSMEGINNYKLTGLLTGATQIGHAWNKVMIDGRWYVVDPTWASDTVEATWEGQSGIYEMLAHKYLFITDEEAASSRNVYGVYPESEQEPYPGGFEENISVDPEYDSLIDSDEEISYYLSTYMPTELGSEEDLWGEIRLSEEYLTDLHERYNETHDPIPYELFLYHQEYVAYITDIENQVISGYTNKSLDILHSGIYFYVRIYSTSP
ncbi:MAG: hypothetical protein GXY10_02100 [Clostridiales bacterium]|nr:hypothetical protein [Clostridiales bacterium]